MSSQRNKGNLLEKWHAEIGWAEGDNVWWMTRHFSQSLSALGKFHGDASNPAKDGRSVQASSESLEVSLAGSLLLNGLPLCARGAL